MADNRFESEVDLCTAYIKALPDVWTAYPETAGWDILLVRSSDGFQIGVEAKLRLNAKVLAQALEEFGYYHATRPGPDCRAVLVPSGTGHDFGVITAHLGLTVIRATSYIRAGHFMFWPELPSAENDLYRNSEWHELCPEARLKLPEYVPDVAAGCSAPIQLTHWKIQALKLAVVLENRGFVTRQDFKDLKIDHRRWISGGWLQATTDGFIRGKYCPDFAGQHPRVYDEIKADFPEWSAELGEKV